MITMSKKDLIMETAIKLFLKKGFADVSNAEIIKESNVGSGTIYYYFEDKNDLIISTIDKYVLEMLRQRLNIIKEFHSDAYSTLEFLFRQMIGCDEKTEPYYVYVDSEDYSFQKAILLACEGIQKFEAISERYNQFNQDLVEFINGFIEKGKDENEIREDLSTKEISYCIQSTLNGIFFMELVQNNIDLNEMIEYNLNDLWNFIHKK